MKNILLIISFIALFSLVSFSQDSGGVKGKVKTAKGEAISDVTITARQKGEDITTVKSNSNGNFVFENLKTGVYNFIFDKEGFGRGTIYNIEVKKGKTIDLGERALGIDQGTLVIIKGSIFDQDGRSLSGAKVEVSKVLEDGTLKKMNTYISSYFGEFTFRFPEGKAIFRITASAKGFETNSKDISVEGAAIYRLAITLNKSK